MSFGTEMMSMDEYNEHKKKLARLKKNVAKLIKSAEKDKKNQAKIMAQVCQLIKKNKDEIDKFAKLGGDMAAGFAEEEKGAGKPKVTRRGIFDFVKEGNCTALAEFIIDGITVDVRDKDLWTPLHVACLNGHGHMVQLLVDAGASLDFRNDAGHNALHVAVGHNHTDVADVILKCNANPFALTKDERYPMSLTNSKEMVNVLKGYEEKFLRDHIDDPAKIKECCESIALYAASKQYHSLMPLIVELHEKEVDVGINAVDPEGNTALHWVLAGGERKDLELLLTCEPFPFLRNGKGKFPTQLTDSDKLKKMMKEYEEAYIARFSGNVSLMKRFGNQLLLYCSAKGYKNGVEDLLDNLGTGQIDINVCDGQENTPLHLAVMFGYHDIAALLLKSGADMLVINKSEMMPCDYIRGDKKLERIFNNFERMWTTRIIQHMKRVEEQERQQRAQEASAQQ